MGDLLMAAQHLKTGNTAPAPLENLHGWHLYWLIWFLTSFAAFLAPEIVALIRGNGGTLSATIWWLEGWKNRQLNPDFADVTKWSAGHFLIGGMLFVVLLWLIGHFVFHRWA